MITDTDRRVREFFSKAADDYEKHSDLQKEIGKTLLEKLDISACPLRILDIGMGTGWLTAELTKKFSRAQVFGLDFAPGMVLFAEKHYHDFRIIEADAGALPFKKGTFKAVVSNAAYQWVEDLPHAFKEVSNVLCGGGCFYFSCFGHDSLKELFLSIRHSLGEKEEEMPQHNGLIGGNNVRRALERNGFQHIKIYSETKKVNFPDMLALVRWLKTIGANGVHRDYFVGKDLLQRAGEFYERHFRYNGGVYATFEIIWGRGEKP